MALTTKELALANLALMLTGTTKTIATASDATNERRVAEAWYPVALEFVLADRPWEFAAKRASLSTEAGTPPTNWAYQYTYPTDAIKVVRVLPATGSTRRDEQIPFQIVNTGTKLIVCTNEQTATVEYTSLVSDPDLFDPSFKQALAYYLATLMAVPLKADPNLIKGNAQAYAELKAQLDKPGQQEGVPEARVSLFDGTAALTAVAVANGALARIGRPSFIQAFTEHTDEARYSSIQYGRSRDFVLADLEWDWATTRSTLAGQAASTNTLWAYSYSYPTDSLKVVRVLGAGATPAKMEPIPFQVVYSGGSRKILTNEPSASAEYIVKVTDPTLFPPVFVEMVTLHMGAALCAPLGQPAELANRLLTEYQNLRKTAEASREGMRETTVSVVDGTTSTALAIVNMGLARLGHKVMVAAFTDSTDEARAANLFFAEAVSSELRSFDWPFATRRAVLTSVPASVVTDWAYAYSLPSDFSAVQALVSPYGRLVRSDLKPAYELGFDSASGVPMLFTDEVDAELVYTSTSVTVNDFDPLFRDALAWRMAADCAPQLGYPPQLVESMRRQYLLAMSIARAAAARETQDGPDPDCEMIASRN